MEKKNNDIRNRLLNSGAKVFIDKGFHKTRLTDIAFEADVTRGAIYYYFDDKLDLLKAIIQHHHESVEELFLLNNIENKNNVIDHLKVALNNLFFRLEDDKQFRIFNLLLLNIKYDNELNELTKNYGFKHSFKILKNIFELATDNDELDKSINIPLYTFIFMSSLVGLVESWLIYSEAISVKKNSKELVEFLFKDLKYTS